MTAIDTHGMICDFGRHKGTPYTRMPVSYLKWMVCSDHSRKPIAEAELKRRGTVTPDLDVSGHAIDRASLNCRKIWHETRGQDEGLHAWLVRMAGEALAAKHIDDKGRYHHKGMKFAFEMDGAWPVLKTIMRKDRKSRGPHETPEERAARYAKEEMEDECHEAGMDDMEAGWDGHKNAF